MSEQVAEQRIRLCVPLGLPDVGCHNTPGLRVCSSLATIVGMPALGILVLSVPDVIIALVLFNPTPSELRDLIAY